MFVHFRLGESGFGGLIFDIRMTADDRVSKGSLFFPLGHPCSIPIESL